MPPSQSPVAYRVLPLRQLQDVARRRCKPTVAWRRHPHLSELHLQLLQLRKQNRGSGYPHRRPGLLRHMLPMPELQEEDRQPAICQDVDGHLLHGMSRHADGPPQKGQGSENSEPQARWAADTWTVTFSHGPRQIPTFVTSVNFRQLERVSDASGTLT